MSMWCGENEQLSHCMAGAGIIIYIGLLLLFDGQRENQVVDNHAQSGIHFTVCQFCMQMNSTHACTNDNMHACINAYILAHSQIHRHTCTHTHTHTCTHTHTHTCVRTHTHLSPTCSLQSRAVPLSSSARRC